MNPHTRVMDATSGKRWLLHEAASHGRWHNRGEPQAVVRCGARTHSAQFWVVGGAHRQLGGARQGCHVFLPCALADDDLVASRTKTAVFSPSRARSHAVTAPRPDTSTSAMSAKRSSPCALGRQGDEPRGEVAGSGRCPRPRRSRRGRAWYPWPGRKAPSSRRLAAQAIQVEREHHRVSAGSRPGPPSVPPREIRIFLRAISLGARLHPRRPASARQRRRRRGRERRNVLASGISKRNRAMLAPRR
jgi:hypothetical protein